MAQYTPDERTNPQRMKKQTNYDAEVIHAIINETPILHVSFNAPSSGDGPRFPTILPMLGAIGTYDNDSDPHLYLHGSSAARLFRLTAGGELPLCVAGTLLDGYILALAPFHNSCNYRSAVVFGHGSMVSDAEEVQFALRLITNNTNPERWENSRSPTTKAELTSTGILKVRIETATTKSRTGGPNDERSDLKNPDVVGKIWTGVVPAYQMLGVPIAAEQNQVKEVPEYIAEWVADANSMAEQRAIDAIDG